MIDVAGLAAVWAALPEARIVGGAVRDDLLGRQIADVDLASPLVPEAVMARLDQAGIRYVPTGLSHGTLTAVTVGRNFEITTLRRDVTTDGRHAEVEFTDDWRVDASRRDFTINAMSLTQDGTIHDYFGGRADLAAGNVRFVGNAAARVQEDSLRILRFFRFFARYGRGAADAEALQAIVAFRDGLKQLSAERVWSEIKAILRAEDPRVAVRLMQATGVLELVLPAAKVAALDGLVARGAPVDALLRVAALLAEDVGEFAARLRLSGAEQQWLAALFAGARLTPEAADDDLRRALAEDERLVVLSRTWLDQDESPGWDEMRARIAMIEKPAFPLLGRDVTALGVPPGPGVGALLDEAKAWWMAGGCVADRAGCLAELIPTVIKNDRRY